MNSRTILFVDDHDVLYRSGTERVLTRFRRHASNPVVQAREYPWEGAIGWTSIYRNPESGKYQLWYQAYTCDRLEERTHDCAVCYAESDDGIHFEKPLLDLFSFEDHVKTNIVMIGNGGYSYRYGNAVVVYPCAADQGKRYKMSYFDWAGEGDQEYPGLCVAFSPDGIVWTKHTVAPLSRMARLTKMRPMLRNIDRRSPLVFFVPSGFDLLSNQGQPPRTRRTQRYPREVEKGSGAEGESRVVAGVDLEAVNAPVR
jgi:hypothetical protein